MVIRSMRSLEIFKGKKLIFVKKTTITKKLTTYTNNKKC